MYFHDWGRRGKRHLQRRFLQKRGAAGKGLALSVKPCRACQLSQRESPWHGGKVSGKAVNFAGGNAPPGGAVAQRLRGYKSAEPEKTVKRSSRRTGVNLQFFPVQPTPLGLKGASSPFFVAPARRNRWHFSGSLLVSKENIPRQVLRISPSASLPAPRTGRSTRRCTDGASRRWRVPCPAPSR